MNEMYVHMETLRKEQLAIRLQHMNGGLNSYRHQPRSQFLEVEGKFIAEHWQDKEDQFRGMRGQIEDLTIQLSNLCRHNEDGSINSFTKCRTQGR
jgi:hypothetical protein